MPWLSAVVDPLENVTKLSKAVLTKAVVSAMYTVFIKDMSGLGAELDDEFAEQNPNNLAAPCAKEPRLSRLGNGEVMYLDEDKEVQIAAPQTDADFDSYYSACTSQIGAAIGVSGEQVQMKYGQNYSASRAAMVDGWKTMKTMRAQFGRGYCQPVAEAHIEECVIKGYLDAPGFFDSPEIRAAYCRGVWVGQGPGQIDPLKETKAQVLRLENNLTSFEDEYTEISGGSARWASVIARRAEEKKTLEAAGLLEKIEKIEAPETETEEGDDEK
jgi:capsid protein